MDIINEEGVLYTRPVVKHYELGGLLVQGSYVTPFYYNKVAWIGTLKFVFGNWVSPSSGIEAMVEVTTQATAVNRGEISGKVTIEKLVQKYEEKLVSHNAKCGEQVVENYNSKFTIQLWQIKLWVL